MAKLSVVVTGTNDNYDGNFDERLITALARNMAGLPEAEFIFVEWNPSKKRGLVSESLKKVFGERVKYYVVDGKFHETYCVIDHFIEYPAKNVGIRRASGDFILCTNSDIIFSPDIMEVMKGPLEKNIVHRATRVDIPFGYVDVEFPVRDEFKLDAHKGHMNGAGDFLLVDKGTWHRITGYCEEFPQQRLHKDAYVAYILVEQDKLPWKDIGEVTHWRHPSSWCNSYKRPKVGDTQWSFKNCGYIKNKETWGLSFAKEENRDGIIWLV